MPDLAKVKSWIASVNQARWPDLFLQIESGNASEAEQNLDTAFNTPHKLAVYGTLAPGAPNYHVVEPYGGEWSDAIIRGDLGKVGWGSEVNYPGFKPREDGGNVSAKILTSSRLPTAWTAIDEFEGEDYRRILVPVYGPDGQLTTVANVYAALLMLTDS